MMKVESTGKKYISVPARHAGFATLEILIAFTVLILCTSAVVMIAFSNQFLAIDSEASIQGLSLAHTQMEKARADSLQDFNSVNPFTNTETNGPLIFTKKLDVVQSDIFTKEVTSSVSWQVGRRVLSTTLTTLMVNKDIIGSDTCSSIVSGDWKDPQTESIIDFSSLQGVSGTYYLSDIDVYQNKLYVTASKTSSASDPTFFIFDINDMSNPALLGKMDNASTVSTGPSALAVSDDYAYLANAYTGSAQSCTENSNCAQLQIVNISDPANPTLIKNVKLPEYTSSGNLAAGEDIFYYKSYVYLGLIKTSGGNEFNILDVSNHTNPVSKGRYSIGNGVNSILIKNNFAYIASPNSEELKILDISDLDNPTLTGGYNSPSGAGHGKSIYLVGNKLYLGKTSGAGFDFHVLDNNDPKSTLPQLGGKDMGTGNSINAVIVRDYLSFLLTNKDLQILDTTDPASIAPWATFTLPGSYDSTKTEPSMDCENNRVFISSNNEGYGSIYIIKPGNE